MLAARRAVLNDAAPAPAGMKCRPLAVFHSAGIWRTVRPGTA